MNNLPIEKKEQLIREIDKNGFASVLKPLNKKILISRPFANILEGMEDFAVENAEVELRIGDERIDENAVDVYDKNGKLIAEIDDYENEVFHNLLKGGKELYATVERVCNHDGYFSVMRVKVYLVEV